VNKEQLAYAAGLFDGEGCVSINKVTAKGYKKPGFQLRASISMTDERMMMQFQEWFYGGCQYRTRPRAKDYWMWVVVARGARDFLTKVEPYLVIKKPQALVGIEFQNYRDNNQSQNKTQEYWDREFELYEQIRRGNARWGTEYYQST